MEARRKEIGFVRVTPERLRAEAKVLENKLSLPFRNYSFTERIKIQLRKLIMEYSVRTLEGISGLIMLLWGAWIILPYDTFSLSPSFAYMSFMPEWTWGITYCILGTGQLISLNEQFHKARIPMTVIGFTAWLVLFVLFTIGTIRIPALMPFGFMLCNAWAYLRLSLIEYERTN